MTHYSAAQDLKKHISDWSRILINSGGVQTFVRLLYIECAWTIEGDDRAYYNRIEVFDIQRCVKLGLFTPTTVNYSKY